MRLAQRSWWLVLGCAVLVLGAVGSAQAAFTSDQTSIKIAEATLSSPSSMTITVKNISNNAIVAQIGWTNTGSGWHEADQYLQFDYTAHEVGWGIQLYTDNDNASANPRYTGPTSAGYEGAGMVGVSDTTKYVPMGWTARQTTGARPAFTVDGNGALISDSGWAYFQDPIQSAFAAGGEYITVVNGSGLATNTVSGRQYGATSPIYVYPAATFADALNQTYRTSRLIVELYHQ